MPFPHLETTDILDFGIPYLRELSQGWLAGSLAIKDVIPVALHFFSLGVTTKMSPGK